MDKAQTLALLDSIKPGKTYPRSVEVTETVEGKTTLIRFLLQSYVVGMYCAIYFPGNSIPHQTGDHNNSTFVRKLKNDLRKAIDRGATVEIDSIANCLTA